MNKNFLLLLLIAGFFLITPSKADAKPIDMVVLLDTSGSVLPIYDDLLNFITKNIISDYLKYGDTFHLLSFDADPSFVISKKINNKKDIESILSDLFLLYPFGKHTDLISALKYLRNYVSGISNDSSREIVILTDGLHDPSEGSPYQSIVDPATGVNLLEKEMEELAKTNWKINIIRLPGKAGSRNDSTGTGSSNTGSGGYSASGTSGSSDTSSGNTYGAGTTGTSSGTSTGSSGFSTSGSSGTSSNSAYGAGASGTTSNSNSNESTLFNYIDNSKIQSSDFNVTQEKDTRDKGDPVITTSSTSSNENSDNAKKTIFGMSPLLLLFIVILIIILIFILIFKFYSGSSVKKSYNVVRNDVDQEGNKSDNSNRRSIIMKVAGQNDQIVGTNRNIHLFKSGAVKSVGGGNCAYLIFLYKIPGTIASLKFDGDKYIFTPIRTEFFPDVANEIDNPLGQDIKIITEKQHKITIKFWEYISPLEKINSIMHLTEHRSSYY